MAGSHSSRCSRVPYAVERVARQPVDADGERNRAPGRGKLFEHLQVHLVRLAAAAEVRVVGQAQQPRARQQGDLLGGEPGRILGCVRSWRQLVAGDLAGEVEQGPGLGSGQVSVDRHQGLPSSTTSEWGRLLRRRTPVSVTATMSSMRAPWLPGS